MGAFCDKIAELKPQLVTFNGNSFDLPVLGRGVIHTHIHQKTENLIRRTRKAAYACAII